MQGQLQIATSMQKEKWALLKNTEIQSRTRASAQHRAPHACAHASHTRVAPGALRGSPAVGSAAIRVTR